MNAIAAACPTHAPNTAQALPQIGALFGGGYFAGQIRIEGVLYGLVMAGAEGELSGRWNASPANAADAVSLRDGRENTISMDAAGSKLAERALALDIGGFKDWYIPSRDELEILYRHFKSSAAANYTGSGVNANSVPTGEKYTRASPAQTTVEALIEDQADALVPGWYWSSTQYAGNPYDAWSQSFDDGFQYDNRKSYAGRARAVRRFAI